MADSGAATATTGWRGAYPWRWWLAAAIVAAAATGPLLLTGPFGLPSIGAATLVAGLTAKRGLAARSPLIAVGALWLSLGVTVALGYGTGTQTTGGTANVHEVTPPTPRTP
jgi:hypothetical protein